jgi:hypothetical protein
MANGAIHSRKTKLQIKDGATWVDVKGFKSFSGLDGSASSVIDVSTLDSDAKEKMFGLSDSGQVSLEFNFIDTDEGQNLMEEGRLSGELKDFRIVLRSGKGYAFSGGILSFEKSGGVDAVIAAQSTVEISGLVEKVTVTVTP